MVDWALAGRLNLLEAAAYFRFLDLDAPDRAAGRRYIAGRTEEEKLCWQVITWVKDRARSGPTADEATAAARLEAELADLLREPERPDRLAAR